MILYTTKSRLDHIEISWVKILLCMDRNWRHSSYYCKSTNKNIGKIIFIININNIYIF